MRATLMLIRNTTAARPLLLLLLPRHATAAKYHTVVPSLASASPAPPRPQNHGRRQEHAGSGVPPAHPRRPLFSNFVGLALGKGGTDGVF